MTIPKWNQGRTLERRRPKNPATRRGRRGVRQDYGVNGQRAMVAGLHKHSVRRTHNFWMYLRHFKEES